MGKYDFENLYKDAIMLDQDFLRNEFGYSLDIAQDGIVYKNYYVNICSAIFDKNAFRPQTNEVEEFLKNGSILRCPQWKSKTLTEEERKYLFLLAQAKQLKYDQDSGRAGMIRGENDEYLICKDTFDLLAKIGFIQPVRY